VVDDEETVRRTVQLMLEARGFRVLLAGNGAEGVETFKRHAAKIDAVLLDATMPIKDGKETLDELRAHRWDVKVILSSGYNELEVTEQFAEGELAGFIQKPYNPEVLFAKINKALAD
jgi:CheY-like chemotaxis protein